MPNFDAYMAQPRANVPGSGVSYTSGKYYPQIWDKHSKALRKCELQGARNNGATAVTLVVHLVDSFDTNGAAQNCTIEIPATTTVGFVADYIVESGTDALTSVELFVV